MGNPITKNLSIGTIGELLVQLRLLQHGIQAAPPIKDSGNDLIAIKEETIKFVQVKTSKNQRPAIPRSKLPKTYHYVALVQLEFDQGDILLLDESIIWLISKEEINSIDFKLTKEHVLTQSLVDCIWQEG